MAAKYPSDAENESSLKSNIRLCDTDQNNPGTCTSSKCKDFHLCREYLFENKCTNFESTGYCSRCHSLFTTHNEKILNKKLNINANDDNAFDQIIKYLKSFGSDNNHHSLLPTSFTKSTIHSRPAPILSDPSHMNAGLVTFRSHFSTMKPTSSRHLSSSFAADSPTQTMLTNSNFSGKDSSSSSTSLGFDLTSKPTLGTRKSMSVIESSGGHSLFSLPKQTDRDNDLHSTHSRTSVFSWKLPLPSIARDVVSKMINPGSDKSQPNGESSSNKELRYIFGTYYQPEHLSYLFGPIRRQLNEKQQKFQIFASGYCRIKSSDFENKLRPELEQAMKNSPKTVDVQLPSDELALFASTSAAEKIFEEAQNLYGIMSKPFSHILSIEVIGKSAAAPGPKYAMSINKLDLHDNHSSIEVIQGDITRTAVDMLVCVTTSKTLLSITLDKAGPAIEAQYKVNYRSKSKFVLDGGDQIPIKKILFAPWELEVDTMDISSAQQSLSYFVEDCIIMAYQHKMKSISFPPIGTGEIRMSPDKVCEAMINAANSCLEKYTMDVRFVILPSRRHDSRPQLYDTFCNYLGELSQKNHGSTSGHVTVTNSIGSGKYRREGQCRHLSTVSTDQDKTWDHKNLIELLEKLVEEKRIDYHLIQKPILKKLDLLTDMCLGYHVLPRIDFAKSVLTLFGDRDSCSQCFANIGNEKKVSRFVLLDSKKTPNVISLNTYVSLKIEESCANDDKDIKIQDNNETTYYVDLRQQTVQINHNSQIYGLAAEQLYDSNVSSPPPLFKIQTKQISSSLYMTLPFFSKFEHVMPPSQWEISEIKSIDNWPLTVHHTVVGKPHDEIFAYYSCSFSSVQSVIHYGLHSNSARSLDNSLQIHLNPLNSHIYNGYRATDGKYYMFVVEIPRNLFNNDLAGLTNENSYLALPKYLITYERK